MAEIKTASAAAQSPATPKPHKVSPRQDAAHSPREVKEKSSRRSTDYTSPASEQTSLVSNKSRESERSADKRFGSSTHEVQESLIEVLDDIPEDRTSKRRRLSETSSARTGSEASDIPEELHSSNEKEESIVEIIDEVLSPREVKQDMDKGVDLVEDQTRSQPSAQVLAGDDSFDIPEEISERSRSTASIPEQVPSIGVDEASKSAEIPEELSERSYTSIPSDASVSEDSRIHSKASSTPQESPARGSTSRGASYSYQDDTFENSYTEPKSSASLSGKKSLKHSERKTISSEDKPNGKPLLEESRSISEHLTGPAEHLNGSVEGHASVSDEPSYTEPDSDTSISEHSSVSRKGQSEVSDISKSLHSDEEISQKSLTSSRRSKATTEDEKSKSDQQASSKPSPEQRAATKSDEEKSPEQVKHSPRVDISSLDQIGSLSETSSIAEEISGGHEDVDISESGNVLREQQSNELKDGGRGLDELDRTELDLPGLKGDRLDITELDQTGSNDPGKNETELDGSGFNESELVQKPDSEESESRIKQSGEPAADISPVKPSDDESDESSKSSTLPSSRSRGVGTNEQMKVSGDEQQYSDDFDDASIQEEISEIDGELSAEDSDKGENYAMFVSNEKAKEISEESTQRSREHESGSHAKHVVDDITNEIYRDIITDSLSSMKNVKSTKSAGNKISDQNELDEQDKSSLTKAFSTVTRKLADNGGPLDTREATSKHDGTQGRGHADTDMITRGQIDTTVDTIGQTSTERSKGGHSTTDSITKDLLADAIMQMIQINQRKKEKSMKLAPTVETKPSETKSSRAEISPPTGKTLPENVSLLTGTTIPENKSPVDEETAIDNALMVAKTNQFLDDDALRSIDDDIAGLLGTPVDDEGEFPVNITNFGSEVPSDNEASLPEYSPMLAVPHSTQELTPMVHQTVDALLEQRRLGRPLKDCKPQAQFLAGETENELECLSIQSYRHLVFDLTKEVFIDTISQNEPASRPPWAKAKWKGGQKLSRYFKRWKSDQEIRSAVLERVTNLIGLGTPRATMATLPRKTPVRGNKKDNVDAILIEELRQEEPLWTDYEEDETNVKFQVADTILNMMLEDTVRVFNAIQAKKHVPDDVLIV